MPKKAKNIEEDDNDQSIESSRQAFTPGWDKSLKSREALPIKVNGKIVRTFRKVESIDADTESSISYSVDNSVNQKIEV